MATGEITNTADFSEELKPSADTPTLAEEGNRPFSRQFPMDALRIILETAADPGDGTFASLSDKGRLKFLRDLCLVDKCAASWIEPLLYKAVVLESDKQVVSFSYALKCKGSEFLSRSVRALWFLHDSEELNRIDFGLLFSTLRRLESFAVPGDKLRLLREISTPSPIRDLILVAPQTPDGDMLCLRHLSLRSLHAINPSETFLRKNEMDETDVNLKPFLMQLSAIPRICMDFTTPPRFHVVTLFYSLGWSLITGEMLRAEERPPLLTSIGDGENPQEERAQPLSLWVKRSANTMLVSAWKFAVAFYTKSVPTNRRACSESPLVDMPEYRACSESPLIDMPEYSVASNLPDLQLIKEMIRYNEVHWDRVARSCEEERIRDAGNIA